MKSLISKIFIQKELIEKPPVLIDIGASEQIHQKWKKIAQYSICIAFDADDRDFKFVEKEQSNFKKLFNYNCVASDQNKSKTDFYLTKSPYCSSVLEPDLENLKPYIHSNLFEVEKKIEINSIHIQKAINDAKLDYIDWFKTDSQGIDLRLFKAIDERLRKKTIVAEFEPGIMDAYIGEDKLYSVLKALGEDGYWLSDINIKGVPRFSIEFLSSEFNGNLLKKLIKESIKKAPGWGEMTFINNFENEDLGLREYLLGWLFSTLERHHSFAFVLAKTGYDMFNYELFNELENFSKIQMKREVYRLKFLPSVFNYIRKKFG
jgi:hypothetical protein